MSDRRHIKDLFDLSGRVVVITGGGGLLGPLHGEAIAEAGGTVVLLDLENSPVTAKAAKIAAENEGRCVALAGDVTNPASIEASLSRVLSDFGRVDAIINNAANDPKTDSDSQIDVEFSRVESFPIDMWQNDIAVGLTGAFLCAKIYGGHMAAHGGGSIVNIASDLSIISPDQRIYRKAGVKEKQQPVKPISYSAVKAGLAGITRYLATYWAREGVRVNAISPAGIYNDHDEEFERRLSDLIPMARMGRQDELKGAILFLCSDASSFVTGHNLAIDGGRTIW